MGILSDAWDGLKDFGEDVVDTGKGILNTGLNVLGGGSSSTTPNQDISTDVASGDVTVSPITNIDFNLDEVARAIRDNSLLQFQANREAILKNEVIEAEKSNLGLLQGDKNRKVVIFGILAIGTFMILKKGKK